MTAIHRAAGRMTGKRLFALIAVLYMALATMYSVITPVFEASDELWHYPMVKIVADTGQLPVQNPAISTPWRQEGSQPPLYYMLAAALTTWIDTSDMDIIRRQNPHADIGLVLPDGNVNMITHRDEPWQRTVLAVHIVRLFSVVLGLGTVLVTYQLAREIFPRSDVIHLGAAALAAFLPMFLFISGSVNNDNLSNLLGNLLLLLVVRLVRQNQLPRWPQYALIGMVTGAGLLSKLNIGFMIPLVALALAILSLRLCNWRPLVMGGLVSGGLTVAIAGWWYWRNVQLYGDPTGLNVFLDLVGRRSVPANLAQLWAERHSFTQAYWGFFGGVNIPLPETIYLIFNIIGGVGLIGAFAYLMFRLFNNRIGFSFSGWTPALFSIAWPLLSFISYLRWTAETPASQGRLMFGALAPISLWMAVGLMWWLPQRLQPILMAAIIAFFAFVALAAPITTIAPAYREPPLLAEHDEPVTDFEGIELLYGHVISDTVQPGDYVYLDTQWRIRQPTDRDWSLFVHLVTPDGVIVSQRDIYPAQGLLATSDLPQVRQFRNPVAVRVPAAAYTPMMLDVNIGWYHLPTGERLSTAEGQETVTIGQVELLAQAGEFPNPLHINFGGLIELVGYELSDLSPAAGDTVELTLYWRGLADIDNDYKVFVNILDPRTLTKYASSDGMPAQWTAPTSTWDVNTIIEDTHHLTVSADAQPGIYELELGLYKESPEGFSRLRVHTPDGGQAENFVYLSRVRILPADEDAGA